MERNCMTDNMDWKPIDIGRNVYEKLKTYPNTIKKNNIKKINVKVLYHKGECTDCICIEWITFNDYVMQLFFEKSDIMEYLS